MAVKNNLICALNAVERAGYSLLRSYKVLHDNNRITTFVFHQALDGHVSASPAPAKATTSAASSTSSKPSGPSYEEKMAAAQKEEDDKKAKEAQSKLSAKDAARAKQREKCGWYVKISKAPTKDDRDMEFYGHDVCIGMDLYTCKKAFLGDAAGREPSQWSQNEMEDFFEPVFTAVGDDDEGEQVFPPQDENWTFTEDIAKRIVKWLAVDGKGVATVQKKR